MELTQRDQDRLDSLFEDLNGMQGEAWFKAFTNRMAVVAKAHTAWLAEYISSSDSLEPVTVYSGGKYHELKAYSVFATPCGKTLEDRKPTHLTGDILKEYPKAKTYLAKFEPQNYLSVPLQDAQGRMLGLLGLVNIKHAEVDKLLSYLDEFRHRAEEALLGHRKKRELDNKEKQLKGLIDGIQDLLINFNKDGEVIMTNTAARNHLFWKNVSGERNSIYDFLTKKDRNDLDRLIYRLDKSTDNETFVYFPEDYYVMAADGKPFEVEGTLNRYELNSNWYYTMVLRSKDHRLRTEEELRSLLDRTHYLQHELEEVKLSSQLIGESEGVKMLWQDIYMVAHTDATVLIHGETGTGKELVARQIHQISNRKSKPMVSINCGAIPANLIESELFGHVKGAFTGAVSDRKGRFELADGGTIFLDEIGELPLEMQVKLLRVIQEKEFEPLGSGKTIKPDVRIVAATHRNLVELTKNGQFRQDLYYRLNVFPIEVPALRERDEDVLVLAENFIRKFEARMGKKINPLSVPQKKVLQNYPWPGNVRELQNILERAVIVSRDGSLDIGKVLGLSIEPMESVVQESDETDKILTKEELLAFERNNIIKALKASGGKVSGKGGAAELLNMVPTTLSSRIVTLGIRKGIYENS